MGKRRMLLSDILQSDDFSKLSSPSQMLYIHFNMEADDDGLLGNPRSIARYLEIPVKHFRSLIDKGYIIQFDSGVIAITHWHLHNKIRKDRYTETRFLKEYSMLKLRAGCYEKISESEAGQGIPDFFDNQSAPQGKAGKERKEKDNSVQSNSISQTQVSGREPDEKAPEDAIAVPKSYPERLTYDERLEYDDLLNKMKLFAFREYGDLRITSFINEYEERNWFNSEGIFILDNYMPELEKWYKRQT